MEKDPDYAGLLEQVKALTQEARERRRVEGALRESETRLKTVLETVQAGIVVIDPETHTIVGVNAAAGKMIGTPGGGILGSLCHEYICPAQEGQCPVTDLGEVFENTEQVLLTHDGQSLPILKTVVPVILAGRKHLLESFVDITERKHAEAELRKINEELNSFVDVVSHDLKNPIMSIQGFCFLLLEQFSGQLTDKGRRYVEQIQNTADQMQVLVTDLLDLSRIGRVVSTREKTPCLDIVKRAVLGLEEKLQANKINIKMAHNLPLVFCDAERLYQVFENLIGNAVKYMGGVDLPTITIGYQDGGDTHCFHVQDNGRGIAPEYHRKIFEMFARGEDTGNEEGTGLGLAIVEKIVRHHGGKVWVESEKGCGARFCFTLPKRPVNGCFCEEESSSGQTANAPSP